jgi:DNA-binding transcriptional ArsR family regulator
MHRAAHDPWTRLTPLLGPVIAIIVLLCTAGCVTSARLVGVKDTASQALEALDDPRNKLHIQRLLVSSEMMGVEKELVAGMVDSSLSALGDPVRAKRIHELASRSMTEMIGGLSSEENQREMERLVGSLVEAGIRPIAKKFESASIGPTLSTAMTVDLGPALQKVLRDNLGPGIAAALEDEAVHRALGATARMMGEEMVLGANEALAKIQKDKSPKEASVLGSISSLASDGVSMVKLLAWGLGLLALALAVWVARLLTLETRRGPRRAGRARATARPRRRGSGG